MVQGAAVFKGMGTYNQIAHNHAVHHDSKNLKLAFFLNLGFTVVEIIGGILTNSVAVLSDAVHDLGDSLSLGLAWYFQEYAKKDPDKVYSYGYGRFSVLGALINAVVLTAGSVFLLIEAIPRIMDPEQPDTTGMMWLAVLGILVNGFAALKLRRGKSMNEQVISLHLIEDVLGWVAVLVASIVMHYYDAPYLDSVLSVAISGYILLNVLKKVRGAFRIMLQGTPEDVDIDEIVRYVKSIIGVVDVHDCHVWSVDGEYNVMTVDVMCQPEATLADLESIKQQIRSFTANQNIEHVTIEFDAVP